MPEDLERQFHRIIRTLPDDAPRDPDVSVLLRHCALTIIGGLDWPHPSDVEAMRSLTNGYGCWLGECERAIAEAPRLTLRDREAWLVAFYGAKALVQALHLPPIPTEWEREFMCKAETEKTFPASNASSSPCQSPLSADAANGVRHRPRGLRPRDA